MSSYVYIPIVALCCYTFLFLALLAAKKNKIINTFLYVLVGMIIWTGGSFAMRMQIWPSYQFWYNISIIGLTLLPFTFYNFVRAFIGNKNQIAQKVWLVLIILANAINSITGVFLACPEPILTATGETAFIYHISWPVIFLYGICGAIVCHIFYLIYHYSKTNVMAKKQLAPIMVGIIVLYAGHIIMFFPFSTGFPADIFCGIINAFFMFYALYKRNLFKLTLLVSRGSCYILAAMASVILFAYVIQPFQRFLNTNFNNMAQYSVLIIAICFALATFGIYYIMKKFIDQVFVKDEIQQAENLKNFSLTVSKSLQVDEILGELVTVIQKTITVKKVYVCIENVNADTYAIAQSTSPLDKKTFYLKKDNPVVEWLQNTNECLLMQDFKRTVAYKAMWEEEKKQLNDLDIGCFVPLKDEDHLVGIVLLSNKDKNTRFTFDDINFLNSVNSIGSIAVKNSRLYEKVYLEARTDELTGLLNRKYFHNVLQREYEKNKDRSLALIILNIDDFKLYNQLYGNKEGDIALQKIARIIEASVGNNGYVARYSGKEFAIILPLYDLLAAKNLAETIRQQILDMNKKSSDGNYALKVLTVSGGVCSIPYAASTVKQLIDNADMAVYSVKRNGKNAIKVYSAGEQAKREILANHNDMEDKESIYSEYASTIYALTAAIDTKDHYTFSHSKNVAYYATELAYAFGQNQECIEIIREAALLHDIGKIGIPEHILNKPGKLTSEEYTIMQGHVENSIGIIRFLPSLDYVIPAVIAHHEHFNGQGYPRRIAGEDIPLSARILCIADSFDAMISMRSYKKPYSTEKALQIIQTEAGQQFDPKLALIFINLVKNGIIKPIHSEIV